MKSRVNPRTGVVGKTVKKMIAKIQQVKPTPPTIASTTILSHEDINALLDALKDIKESIVTELRTARIVSVQSAPPQLALDPHREMEITIDESISDVGIGDVEELKKGEEAGSVGKDETQNDQDLSKSKSRLRALKKGK